MINKPPFCSMVGNRTFAARQKLEILLISDTRQALEYSARPRKPFPDPPKITKMVQHLLDKKTNISI